MAVILLPQGPGAYGWADLVRALGEQAMVLVESPEQSRWMAASEGVVATEDDELLGLLDLDKGVQLDRVGGEKRIGRRKISFRGSREDQMVLALLLGRTANPPSLAFLENARIAREKSEVVTLGGAEHVQLSVDVESDGFEPVSLRLLVNLATGLPTSCNVTGWNETAQNLAFTYPETNAAELVAMNFPDSLPVFDYQSKDLAVVEPAALEKTVMKDATAIDKVGGSIPQIGAIETPAITAKETVDTADIWPLDEDVAPSAWRPVKVESRTGQQVTQELNRVLAESWKHNNVQPTVPATDEELLRRVYLDLAGRTPGVSEVRAYLNDKSANRYQVLVDRLLGGNDHATHLATTFRAFLIPDSVDVTAFGGVEAFDKWLAEEFERGESYDDIVKSLVLAEGRLSRSGPLAILTAPDGRPIPITDGSSVKEVLA